MRELNFELTRFFILCDQRTISYYHEATSSDREENYCEYSVKTIINKQS